MQVAAAQYLLNLGIKINTDIGFLACADCQIGFYNPSELYNHFQETANHSSVKQKDFIEVVWDKLPKSRDLETIRTNSYSCGKVVDGLKIFNGFKCSSCSRISVSEKYLKQTCSQDHCVQISIDNIKCQTFKSNGYLTFSGQEQNTIFSS